MEEILERQLFIRDRTFATLSTIEKALAGRKKSLRGPYVVQASFGWMREMKCRSRDLFRPCEMKCFIWNFYCCNTLSRNAIFKESSNRFLRKDNKLKISVTSLEMPRETVTRQVGKNYLWVPWQTLTAKCSCPQANACIIHPSPCLWS